MTGFAPGHAPAIKLGNLILVSLSAQATFWAIAPPKCMDTEDPPRRMINAWIFDTLLTDVLLASEPLERMGLLPPNWPHHVSFWGTRSAEAPRTDFPPD